MTANPASKLLVWRFLFWVLITAIGLGLILGPLATLGFPVHVWFGVHRQHVVVLGALLVVLGLLSLNMILAKRM